MATATEILYVDMLTYEQKIEGKILFAFYYDIPNYYDVTDEQLESMFRPSRPTSDEREACNA